MRTVRQTGTDSPVLTFHFPTVDGAPRPIRFERPVRVIEARRLDDVRPALAEVERETAEGAWAAGFVTYEAAPAFDPDLVVRNGARMPLAWFGIFDAPGSVAAPADGEAEIMDAWLPDTARDEYDVAIAAIHDAIARGETEQVNYTIRLRSRFRGDAAALFERLRQAQGGHGYAADLDIGRFRILSASPELFFRRTGSRVVVRPMKGTARRGRFREEDDAAMRALAASEKDRAENRAIVELMRGELGRIARAGSVSVASLYDVERYPTVFQMTSTLEAEARPGTTLVDLFTALFPCGSVTGAPKAGTMHMIAALERSPREIYCGAIGYVEPGGDCCFNVPIRTLWLDRETGTAEYGVGGGITRASTAGAEYDEALAKALVLTRSSPRFELIETLRLEEGRYPRLERHLQRLRDSAAYFGFADPVAAARAALVAHAEATAVGVHRVRLLTDRHGAVRIESAPHRDDGSNGERDVALAPSPVASDDPFLYHKTTHRAIHDAARAAYPACFDVLLHNERGELTEFTRGNLVVELDDGRWTPPRDAGLLAGTLRSELLERGEIAERTLRHADLERARRVWFINSLRGWVPVRVIPR